MSRSAHVQKQVKKALPYTVHDIGHPSEIVKWREEVELRSVTKRAKARDRSIDIFMAAPMDFMNRNLYKTPTKFQRLKASISNWISGLWKAANF